MIIDSSNKKASEFHGVINQQEFAIGDSAMVISYLRETIYKNSILALCREISCNARDAHREVHNDSNNPTTRDTPIEITFPTVWNLDFKVKDYGPGISPDRMSEIFIQFGKSTKRDSNDQVGAFGLGCKSPFAYSDTFTVETIFDGVKYIYNAFLDGGAGKMALLYEEKTDEPSGTTIIVPVCSSDQIDKFVNYTMMATAFWDVKPILKGITPAPQYQNHVKKDSGDGWYILENYQEDLPKQAIALMDGVPYPIDSWVFKKLTPAQAAILGTALVLDFQIGDLLLAPSRDSLRYDERDTRSQDAIIKKLAEIEKVFADRLENEVINAKTFKEACTKYLSFVNKHKTIYSKLDAPTWNGLKIRESFLTKDLGGGRCLTYEFRYHRTYGRDKLKVFKTEYRINFLNDLVIIIHNDKDKNMPRDVVEWLFATKSPSTVHVITPDENTKLDILELMGAVKLSEMDLTGLPKKEKKKAAKLEKDVVQAYKITPSSSNGYYYRTSSGISTEMMPISTEYDGVYVLFNYKERMILEQGTGTNIGIDLFTELSRFIDKRVYGFSEKRAKKLSSSWVPLRQAVQDKLNEILKKYSMQDIADYVDFIKPNKYSYSDPYYRENESSLAEVIEKVVTKNLTKDLIVNYLFECKKIKEIEDSIQLIIRVIDWLGIKMPEPNEVKKINTLYNDVKARYPLLTSLPPSVSAEAVKEYIELIDKRNDELTNWRSAPAPIILAS